MFPVEALLMFEEHMYWFKVLYVIPLFTLLFIAGTDSCGDFYKLYFKLYFNIFNLLLPKGISIIHVILNKTQFSHSYSPQCLFYTLFFINIC